MNQQNAIDEFGDQPASATTGQVSPDTAARVFAAAEQAGLLGDRPPDLPRGDLPPDSLIAILTLRYGDAVRRVTMPAAEPGEAPDELPGEAVDVPMETHVRLESGSVDALWPVLDALRDVEAAL